MRRPIHRRSFIRGAAAFTLSSVARPLPVAAFCQAVLTTWAQRARAEAEGVETPRYYVNVLNFGAVSRYSFDHWIRINETDPQIIPNKMVATRFVESSSAYIDSVYETFDYKGTLVPHFFRHSVDLPAGATPLTQLLENLLVIRGYGTGVDGHTLNSILQGLPVAGASSISGVAADASLRSFVVQFPSRGPTSQFYSSRGKGLTVLTDIKRPAHELLKAFGPLKNPGARELKQRHNEAVESFYIRLKNAASQGGKAEQILSQNLLEANLVMKRGLGELEQFWDAACTRYRDIIHKALRTIDLPGVSDKPIVNPGTDPMRDRFRLSPIFKGNSMGLIKSEATDNIFDLRTSLNQATLEGFAEGFALAEFLIRSDLGSVIELQLGEMFDVFADIRLVSNGERLSGLSTLVTDGHEIGAIGTLLYSTAWFRAYAAAVLELSTQLKSLQLKNGRNAWQETVVQLSSDFGRSARVNSTGSDHGFNQMITSLASGCIEGGPFVVGNVTNAPAYEGLLQYAGTQGVGGPIADYPVSGIPTPAMAASTVVEVLRAGHNPFQNIAPPLVRMQNERLQYASFGRGKTVGD